MYRSKASHGGRRTTGRSEGLFCNYSHRICMQDRHEGFEYCLDHILEDKSAPFKQCNFVSTKTGQKCQKAAPKADRKEGYCPAHARKAAQMRHKAALKAKPTDAVKDTLDELDYYRPTSSKSVPETPPSLATKILDYGSESESDGDPLLLDQAWRGTTDSDAESVDSEQEDSLKYAGVYTAEEAALITRDKLIRLQSLYINQFKRLQHLMREKRRQYLIAQQQERETYGIDFGVITDPKQKRKFREYQAARGFRRRKGKEALLYQKSKRRRIEATPDYQGKQKVPLMLQCCYTCPTKEKEQCSKFSLPMAKFCKDHILMDPKQVLYVECTKGNGHCDRPASLMAPDESCSLHMGLPEHVPYKPYEPEPPPPPPPPPVPKQVPVPQPPPTIIPIPEQALPPAPILPSQLDSQIDQLLQFQPHFLEQQLQQHVYDTSQLLSSFAQPDMDIQVDSQGDVQADTNVAGASQATQMTTADSEGSNQLDIDKSGLPTNEGTAQYSIQVDAQTDIHVDVETDLPSDGQPEVEESVQTGQQVSATWTSPSASVDQKDTEHTDSSENANVGAQERGSEAVDMAEDVPMQTEQSLPSDKAEEPTQGQTETGTDLKQEVQMTDQHISQADVTENTPEATDMTVPPVTEASQIVEDTVISSTTVTVDEQSACHATGDHNYNQQPSLVSPEPSEQIIDVTGIPDESASNQDLDLETEQSSDQRECSSQDQTTPGSEDLLSNSGTGN